jgi:hypothetical protein
MKRREVARPKRGNAGVRDEDSGTPTSELPTDGETKFGEFSTTQFIDEIGTLVPLPKPDADVVLVPSRPRPVAGEL